MKDEIKTTVSTAVVTVAVAYATYGFVMLGREIVKAVREKKTEKAES